MMTSLQRFVGLALFAGVACLTMQAQITGDIRGSVVDPSGAAVANAKITLTNAETKQTRTQTTGSSGDFSFDLLAIGQYTVKAEAQGFSGAETQADVKTGEQTPVNFKMQVGSVSQVVDVTTAVAQIDVENAQLQTSIAGQAVQEIPVGRNPNIFALMAPGVAPISQNNPYLGTGSFNSNGGRGRANNIMVDGITAEFLLHQGSQSHYEQLQRGVRAQRELAGSLHHKGRHQRPPRRSVRVSAERQAEREVILRSHRSSEHYSREHIWI
jgi:hypothetical protein